MHTQIGPYRILRELGRGGMGVVYAGVHVELGREAAIKLELDTSEDSSRFHRECLALAALDHPGIVKLFETGVHGGHPWVALEFVEGASLEDSIANQGPWEPKRVAELGLALVDAIRHVHGKKLLHRDLKPDNVLLTRHGAVKVTDFGLVRDAKAESLTVTGAMIGTPSYMSPEQASGEKERFGRPTDIYGIGATLFAALTGAPPFRGDSPLSTVTKVLSEPPPAPSSLREGIDAGMDGIVLRCLEKEPEMRCTIDELERDLRLHLAGELETKPGRGKLVGGLAALLLVLGGGAGVALAMTRPTPTPTPTPTIGPEDARAAWRKVTRTSRQDVERWWREFGSIAAPELRERAGQSLAELAYAEVGPGRASGSDKLPLSGDVSALRDHLALVAWRKEFEGLAPARLVDQARGRLELWSDAQGKDPVPVLAAFRGADPKSDQHPLVLPDGSLLVYGKGGGFVRYDLETGKATPIPMDQEGGSAKQGVWIGDRAYFACRFGLASAQGSQFARHTTGKDYDQRTLAAFGGGLFVGGAWEGRETGFWSFLPQVPSGEPIELQPVEVEGAVRSSWADEERLFLAGGGTQIDSKNFFLVSMRLERGKLVQVARCALEASGVYLAPPAQSGKLVLGLNRGGAVLYAQDDLSRPAAILDPSPESSDARTQVSTQILGSLVVRERGLLLGLDDYQNKRGALAYFAPEILDAEHERGARLVATWQRKLPGQATTFARSRDGRLIFVGTRAGYVLAIPALEE